MSEPATTTEYSTVPSDSTIPSSGYSTIPSLSRTTIIGAVAGAIAAVGVLIVLTPLLLERVSANSLNDGTARVDAVFEFTGLEVALPELISLGDITLFESDWSLTPLFMFSLLTAVGFGIAGALTVAITRWLPRSVDPAATSGDKPGQLYLNGIGTGVIVGVLAAQFAATWLGSSTGINLEIPIFGFLVTLVVGGATLGATVAATTHIMVRPDVVGVEGNTWESRSEFFGALRRAISIPVMALTAIALVVVVFGVFLLESADIGAAGPIVLAGVVASLILGGASFVAYKK